MSHHSSDRSLAFIGELTAQKGDLRRKLMESAAEEQLTKELGPTKDYPHGKIVPHDEGGLMFGLTVVHGRVVFDFGKPVRSIGFTREGALELADLIRQRALQCPPIIGKEKASRL